MLYLDSHFLQSWRTYLEDNPTDPGAKLEAPPIFGILTSIVVQTPHLRSLSFIVAESIGPGSVWRKFGGTSRSILSLAPIKAFIQPRFPAFTFSELTSLRVDGFEGLDPLLRMCPSLQRLDVLNSGGFDHSATVKLLECLQHLPHLKSMSFSPRTLALPFAEPSPLQHSAGLVKAIGERLPLLERLSLQTRWLGYGVFLVPLGAEPEVNRFFPLSSPIYAKSSLNIIGPS